MLDDALAAMSDEFDAKCEELRQAREAKERLARRKAEKDKIEADEKAETDKIEADDKAQRMARILERMVAGTKERRAAGCPQQAVLDLYKDNRYMTQCEILDNLKLNPPPDDCPGPLWHCTQSSSPRRTSPSSPTQRQDRCESTTGSSTSASGAERTTRTIRLNNLQWTRASGGSYAAISARGSWAP